MQLEEGTVRLKEEILCCEGGRRWPRLPRAAVGAPSLAGLKARLDGALGNLGWGEVALPGAGGWNLVGFKVPSNPNQSIVL